MKRVESALPISKPFLRRKSLRHSYHALGACTHGLEILNLQSPVVAQHKLILGEVHSIMHSSCPFDGA
jgi:hypothetical protein